MQDIGFELAPFQKRLWMLHTDGNVCNNTICVVISGELDQANLHSSFNSVVASHDNLKTRFVKKINVLYPFQIVSTDPTPSIKYLNLVHDQESDNKIQALISKLNYRLFDLNKDALIEAHLLRVEENKHIFIITIPSIIGDARSLTNLITYVSLLYNNSEINYSGFQFSQYSEWHNELLQERDNEAHQFWRQKKHDNYQNLKISFQKNVIIQDPIFYSRSYNIKKGTLISLKTRANELGCDLSTILFAFWKSLLWQYLELPESVTSGFLTDGRIYDAFSDINGLLAKILPVKSLCSKEKSFESFVKDIQEEINACIGWQNYFDWELVPGEKQTNAFIPYTYQYIKLQQPEALLGGTQFSIDKVYSCLDMYQLNLQVNECEEFLKLDFNYLSQLFSEKDAECIGNRYVGMIDLYLAERSLVLNDFIKPTTEEIEKIHLKGDTVDNLYQSYIELFEKNVSIYGDHVAVAGKDKLTYKQLDQKSNQLAQLLINDFNVKPGDIIGVLLPRTVEQIICLIGIHKACAAYLIFYDGLPPERLQFILGDAKVRVLLTDKQLESVPASDRTVLFIDSNFIDNLPTSSLNPGLLVKSSDLSYVIYTSGTTGLPKGVLISHGSLVNYVMWFLRSYEIGVKDKTILFSSLSFDLCYTSLWGSLCGGGELHLYKDFEYLDPSDLWNELVSAQISYIKLTPSHFRMLLGALNFQDQVKQNQLRLIVIGGESIKADDLSVYFGYRPEVKFVNHYGPTETTIGTIAETISYADFALFRSRPVIGRGISNSTIYILQADNEISPIGISGEICVGGNGLSLGYLNQPLLTAERFIANPYVPGDVLYRTGDIGRWLSDGRIEYLGRKDTQVKIRGYRVELGEIESVLKLHEGVKAAVVDVDQSADQEPLLIGYVVLGFGVSTSEVFPFLQGQLPGYMIPSALIKVDDIPLSGNGKVDMKKLRQEKRLSDHIYEAAVGHEETLLVNIWEEVLLRNQIGVTDNFFELGGHSLKAVQVVSRIYKELEVKIELRDLFENPTIRELVSKISKYQKGKRTDITPIEDQEHYPVSNSQKRLWILDKCQTGLNAYNMVVAYILSGQLNIEALEKAFKTVIIRHEILRTHFKSVLDEPRQKVLSAELFNFKIDYINKQWEKTDEESIINLQKEEANKVFDLSEGLLIKVKLIQTQPNRFYLLLIMHHIISDGWSKDILLREVAILYNLLLQNKKNDLIPLTLQFKDYAIWQLTLLGDTEVAKHRQFWLDKLKGNIPELNFPVDFPRPPVKTYNGDTHHFLLPAHISDSIKLMSKKHDATVFITLIAFVNALLNKYTGQNDIIIGIPVAERSNIHLEGQIGMYLNNLCLRTVIDRNSNFEELLINVKEGLLEAYEHQNYPFDNLVNDLKLIRDVSKSPLFDIVILKSSDIQGKVVSMESIDIHPIDTGFRVSTIDIRIVFNDSDDNIGGVIDYNTDLFKAESITNFAENLEILIDQIINKTALSLADIDLISGPSVKPMALVTKFNF